VSRRSSPRPSFSRRHGATPRHLEGKFREDGRQKQDGQAGWAQVPSAWALIAPGPLAPPAAWSSVAHIATMQLTSLGLAQLVRTQSTRSTQPVVAQQFWVSVGQPVLTQL